MTTTPLILIPGFWLGGWAWDDVVAAAARRASTSTPDPARPRARRRPRRHHARRPRPAVVDLVDSLDGRRRPRRAQRRRRARRRGRRQAARPRPARDLRRLRTAARRARPSTPAATEEVEVPLPTWEEFAAQGSSIEGIVRRAPRRVPPTRGARTRRRCVRGAVHVSDPRRFDVPATAICTSLPSEQLKPMAHGGPPFHTELGASARPHLRRPARPGTGRCSRGPPTSRRRSREAARA